MKNDFFEQENEVILSDLDNIEPMPLEASEELIEDLIEESKLDEEEIERVIQETEEAIAKGESQDGEDSSEILDEVGEGLLADDELDEMELVSDYDYSEDSEAEPFISAEENVEEPTRISELIEGKRYAELKAMLDEIPYVDIAEVFTEVDPRYHAVILRLLGKEAAADVFVELDTETQKGLIESFSDRELAAILEEMYLDDTVDIIEEMPAAVVKRIIKSSSKDDREMINRLLLFDRDTAGAIMTTEYVRLIPEMTVGEALEHIKTVAIDKETIYTCYVTDRKRHLLGIVTAKSLLLNDSDVPLEDIMEENVVFLRTSDDKEEVALLFDRYGFLALPVVDSECRLVGIVTVDDAMDVIREETEEDFAKMAGMAPTETTYLKTSAFDFLKARLPWLLLLMFSATISSAILTIFEDALSAALVLFVPMIMGTGGNSGGQSSVTVIRSLSLGEIEFKDLFRVMRKELTVGILAGALVGLATFVKVVLIDRLLLGNPDVSLMIALAVAVSLALTIVFAKLIGAALPILAKKIGFDPAVMASPFITTLVDAASLLIYFVIAAEAFALRV
jgi:magnesium transporter